VCLKEVVVLRDPPTIHVYDATAHTVHVTLHRIRALFSLWRVHCMPSRYDIVESGRRLYRSIVFSSDASHCLASLLPRQQEQRATSHVQRVMGNANALVRPAPSLVISRQISAALGEQTYIPGRYTRAHLRTLRTHTLSKLVGHVHISTL
jgi:hypothetical protein